VANPGSKGTPQGSGKFDMFAGGGRDGKDRGDRGDRRGGRGKGRDGGESYGASHRVVTELSVLEKALSKADFPTQRTALESVLKALRPIRVKSIEDLDLNTRGRLLTTLLRVSRQPKPPPSEAPAPEAASSDAPAAESSPPEASQAEAPTGETPAQEASSEEGAAPASEATAEAPSSETSPSEAAASTETAKPAPVDDKGKAYSDVMFLIGRIWRAVNDTERAQKAFEASGRSGDEVKEEELPAAQAKTQGAGGRPDRKERPARGEKGRDRKERGDRGERKERPARGERPVRTEAPKRQFADWREEAKHLETTGRTRDAARLYERNKEPADAVRLFEAGGDVKSALRCALAESGKPQVQRLLALVKPQEAAPILEKAEAFEELMELYIRAGEFHNVAGLYERARQFDQAALAWERAQKYSQARKAFERAKDTPNALRMRKLEVDKLMERGDRLGAATVLLGAGAKDEALESLKALPSSKAYRFLQQLKLNDEAQALAKRELETAERENKPGTQARWYETVGDLPSAASAWEKAGRTDKALELYKKLGDTQNAERVAALPPPEATKLTPEPQEADTEPEAGQENASAPAP
jgi:tetratricopeptide (TPR) repeat protein